MTERNAVWYAVFGAEYSRIVGAELQNRGRRTIKTKDAVMDAVRLADMAQYELERRDWLRKEEEEKETKP